MPKMSGYVKTFKHKCGDKNKSFKLISLCIDDDKLLEKYKTIRTKTEDLKNIKLDASLVYHDRYIKTKTKTYSDKVCTNFCVLNVREDGVECEFFTVTSVDFLLLYEKNITCNYIQKIVLLKNIVILMTSVIKDSNKFYPQLFLEEKLHDE